jgi:hypothetical protein
MSDKALLQSGSVSLTVGGLGPPNERRRARARVKRPMNALGTPLALRSAVRTKETR